MGGAGALLQLLMLPGGLLLLQLLLLPGGLLAQLEYAGQLRLGVVLPRARAGRAEGGGLRVTVHRDGSLARLPGAGASQVEAAVEEAVGYWRDRLEARGQVAAVLLDRQCQGPGVWSGRGCPADRGCAAVTRCGEVTVPESHLSACELCGAAGCSTSGPASPGVRRTDLLLYVSAVESGLCRESSATAAHASHCQQEAELDRPVAAHVNICPGALRAGGQGAAILAATIKHELLHVLGFSVQLYGFFRDGRGEPRTARDAGGRPPLHSKYYLHLAGPSTVRKVVRQGWQVAGGKVNKTGHFLVTPRVRREARRHFGCSALEGGELEDQGDLGTAMTHWEKRLFGDEAMTGNHQELKLANQTWREAQPISRISLAVLQDSGWYKVRFRLADPYTWGRGLGCSFARRSCLEWMRGRGRTPRRSSPPAPAPSIAPYCDSRVPVQPSGRLEEGVPGRAGCQREATTPFCNLVQHPEPLPARHRNLEAGGRWGAGMWLADYCPTLVTMYSWHCGDT